MTGCLISCQDCSVECLVDSGHASSGGWGRDGGRGGQVSLAAAGVARTQGHQTSFGPSRCWVFVEQRGLALWLEFVGHWDLCGLGGHCSDRQGCRMAEREGRSRGVSPRRGAEGIGGWHLGARTESPGGR